MAVDFLGAKRQPQFLDTGAPDIAVDDSAVANYAAEFGNHKIGTAAERATATAWAWPGLHWTDSDGLKSTYIFDGTGWKTGAEDTGWIAPTLMNGWKNLAGGFALAGYRRLNGVVHLRGVIHDGSVGGGNAVLALPSGFRPAGILRFMLLANTSIAIAHVDQTNGYVAFSGNAPSNASLSLDSIRFPADA